MLPPSRLYPDIKRVNSHSSSYQSRRDFRKILSVKSALNVRMRTTSVSPLDNALMMSVELENNTDAGGSFSVEVVNVEIAYGFVTRYDWGPKDKKVCNTLLIGVCYSNILMFFFSKNIIHYFRINSR